jgi:hypothetical protein
MSTYISIGPNNGKKKKKCHFCGEICNIGFQTNASTGT